MTKAILCAGLKGGVGKTTLATSVAKNLDKVTVIDGDIDSSNYASIMGVEEKAEITKNHEIQPVRENGTDIYSIETLFQKTAISLREGEEKKLVSRLVHHAVKGQPEYLVVDCPPGSSSAFRGLIDALSERNVERTVIAISQPNALSDLERLVTVCNHFFLPIAGFIENMSGIEGCPDLEPFGKGGVKDYCEELGGKFFGRIPLVGQEKTEEVMSPIVKEAVDHIISKDTFMNRNPYPKAGFWDKAKSLINMGLASLSNNLPIGKLREEYGFEEENLILEIHITDLDKKIHFRVRGGRIKYVKNPPIVAGGIKLPLKELRDSLRLKKEVLDSPTGEVKEMKYSVTEAIELGFASIWRNQEVDLPIEPYDMLMLFEYLLREHIGRDKIKNYLADEGVI